MTNTKIIGIYLEKGGAGKTSNTANIAYELSRIGKTLIIDADHQGNITYQYEPNFADNPNDFKSVLSGETELKDAIIKVREYEDKSTGLYLLGTHIRDKNLTKFIETDFRDNPMVIKGIIEQVKELDFQYLLFDLSPNYGFYERMLLSNANVIVPVVNVEDFAMNSLTNFPQELKALKLQYGAKLDPLKYLIVNNFDKSNKVHQYWMNELKESPYEIYIINHSKAIVGAIAMHQSIQEYNPSNSICETIKNLVEKIK